MQQGAGTGEVIRFVTVSPGTVTFRLLALAISPGPSVNEVDGTWGTAHTGCLEVTGMTRSYDEVSAERRARLSPEAKEQRRTFEQAYDVAVQVIELRERHGLTQAELAARCGIDQGDISRIERGSTSPTARTLERIAAALDANLRLVARTEG